MDRINSALIKALPKTDLHCHLDGSLRLETLIELSRKEGINLPFTTPLEIKNYYKYGMVRETLPEYLKGFEPLIAVMQKADNIERIFYELCEDAALENVWHLEVRYCPYLFCEKGLKQEEVVEACIKAARRAKESFGISVVQILCGLKHHGLEKAISVVELAAKYREQGVVAFDLAGPEAGFPLKDFSEATKLARKKYLYLTLHAGEAYGPESIKQAVMAGADRIGHGTALIEDEALWAYVVDKRIGIETCPLSNLHTGSVKALEDHPLKRFLARQTCVFINTDNRLCSDTSICQELMTMLSLQKLSLEEIKKLLLNGFKSAFLSFDKKKQMIEKYKLKCEELNM